MGVVVMKVMKGYGDGEDIVMVVVVMMMIEECRLCLV